MVAGFDRGCGHRVELACHFDFAREGRLNGLGGRLVVGRGRWEPGQIEVDLVVDQESDDLLGVARLLAGLIAEELGPLVEALSFEVERDAEVGLMGTELAGNLANEKLSKSLADHSVPRLLGL